MKERPIIISTQLIPPTLDDRKTMTRRPVRHQRSYWRFADCKTDLGYPASKNHFWAGFYLGPDSQSPGYFKCPYGQPGDRLWVKETYCIESNMGIAGNEEYPPPFNDGRPVQHHMDLDWGAFWDQCHYKATDPTPELAYEDTDQPAVRWKPSIFMPRWASRIDLEIVKVRVERLQEITEEDCLNEGISVRKDTPGGEALELEYIKDYFRAAWGSLYTKKPEFQWEANPWVWVVEFEKCPTNADILVGQKET